MRVLIANPFGIGDALFSLPLVRAIRRVDPQGWIGYLCNRRTEDLVRFWPELNGCIVFEKDEFRLAWRDSKPRGIRLLQGLISRVRRERFEALVDLSLGWQIGLAGRLAGIPVRVGYNFRNRGKFLTRAIPISGFHSQSVADYYLQLLSLLGLPSLKDNLEGFLEIPENDLRKADQLLRGEGFSGTDRLVGMIPGGGASWGPDAIFKQWPPTRFAELAQHLTSRWQARVLLLGDAREGSLCERVRAGSNPARVRVIQTDSLRVLAAMLKRCHLVVGNDSGPIHLAAFVGTPTVSLFGPVDPAVYGPFIHRSNHRILSKGIACQPCYQSFRFPPCPWENACLRKLETSEVITAVDEFLQECLHAEAPR